MKKRLYRSRKDKQIAGVAAGIAEYFDIDPTIVRVLLAIVAFSMFRVTAIAYIVAAIILPVRPEGMAEDEDEVEVLDENGEPVRNRADRRQMFGLVFVGGGMLMLMDRYLSWMDSDVMLAIGIIGIGAYILLRKES